MPVYFILVAIYLVGRQLGGSAPILFGGPLPWWSYLVGLQNVWMAVDQTYGATWLAGTWSLAIEEQFYLVFPLVVYLAPPKTIPWVLMALLVLCPAGRVIAYCLGDELGYYVLMPLRADVLAIGALIAWLEFSSAIDASVRRIFQAVFWTTLCCFPIFAWIVENSTFNNAVWGHTYLTAFYGSMVFMVLDRKRAPQLAWLRSGFAAFFARISYALYLTHGYVLILVFLVAGYDRHGILTWQGGALTLCAFAISVAICAASYRFIEGPLIKSAHRRFSFDKPGKISEDLRVAVNV